MSDAKSLIDEINEELKHDEFMKKCQKHQTLITVGVCSVAVGIFIFQWWRNDVHSKKIATTMNVLKLLLQNSDKDQTAVIDAIIKIAPSILEPYLQILKVGKSAKIKTPTEQDLKILLNLYDDKSVNLIWRHLSLLIYSSYSAESGDKIIAMLEPIATPGLPFWAIANELIATEYVKLKSYEKAILHFKKITDNQFTSEKLKQRIHIMLSYVEKIYIKNGGKITASANKNVEAVVDDKEAVTENLDKDTAKTDAENNNTTSFAGNDTTDTAANDATNSTTKAEQNAKQDTTNGNQNTEKPDQNTEQINNNNDTTTKDEQKLDKTTNSQTDENVNNIDTKTVTKNDNADDEVDEIENEKPEQQVNNLLAMRRKKN